MKREIIRDIRDIVEPTGAKLEIVTGGRHQKVLINGRFVSILPMNIKNEGGRGHRNTMAQVRRMLRELQQ